MHVTTTTTHTERTKHEPSTNGIERSRRDERLIAEYRAGRTSAFEDLVNSYDTMIRRHLQQLSGNYDVDDLEQEVFLKIFRNMHHFKGQSSFYTWLYRITINVYFDSNKKRKRSDVRLEKIQQDVADVSVIRHEVEDPYTTCFDHLTDRMLRDAIAKLPDKFASVVGLRELEDYSYEEIATKMNITLGTVRSRMARGRSRLRTILAPALERATAA